LCIRNSEVDANGRAADGSIPGPRYLGREDEVGGALQRAPKQRNPCMESWLAL